MLGSAKRLEHGVYPNRNPGDVIHGSGNSSLKYVRSLQRRKTRATERAFVVEGTRAVADALDAGARPILLLFREGITPDELLLKPIHDGVPVRRVTPELFDALSDTVSPQGVLAVFPFPNLSVPSGNPTLYVVADQIRDPGNLGSLIRSAAGAGASALFIASATVDPYNPKCVRGAMGAHFRLPISQLTSDVAERIVAECPLRAVADTNADVAYDALDWTAPAAVFIGSEAIGPSADVAGLGTVRVSIPLAAAVESLNAAVAGSVILFEAARQRRHASKEISLQGLQRKAV